MNESLSFRLLLCGLLVALGLVTGGPARAEDTAGGKYDKNEIANDVADFFGTTTEGAAQVVERVFSDQGQPNAYVRGEEASGAFIGGLRYGKGELIRKGYPPVVVYWQGPSVGFDFGGNASKVFVLVYNLNNVDEIYHRFPGPEGNGYFVAGLGVNYQQKDDVVLAPIRTGLGLRLGANIGYLSYSRNRHWLPL